MGMDITMAYNLRKSITFCCIVSGVSAGVSLTTSPGSPLPNAAESRPATTDRYSSGDWGSFEPVSSQSRGRINNRNTPNWGQNRPEHTQPDVSLFDENPQPYSDNNQTTPHRAPYLHAKSIQDPVGRESEYGVEDGEDEDIEGDDYWVDAEILAHDRVDAWECLVWQRVY